MSGDERIKEERCKVCRGRAQFKIMIVVNKLTGRVLEAFLCSRCYRAVKWLQREQEEG